MAKIPLHVTT